MSDQNRNRDNNGDEDPLNNLFGMFFGQGNPGQNPQFGALNINPAMLGSIMGQLQSLFSGGPNASQAAVKAAQAKVPTPDPAVTAESERTVADAFRLAELWLEKVTDPALGLSAPTALTRADWVKATAPGWLELVSPIQKNMTHALSGSMRETLPEEMRAMLDGMTQMMESMSASLFGAQVGEGLGNLSGSVLTGLEYSLPVTDFKQPLIIEANIAGEAAERDLDTAELRIYMAANELAKLWLFNRTPWLAGHIKTALAKYAAGIEIDSAHIQNLAANMDPNNLAQASEELREGLFKPSETETQKQAKATLTRILSVVAGWADVVTYEACQALSQRDEIREAMRTRLTTTSSSESALTDLIGIDFTPTRMRDAAALITFLQSSEGAAGRDSIFTHPDALPTDKDLDDPLGYRERRTAGWSDSTETDDFDEALQRLLDEESGRGQS